MKIALNEIWNFLKMVNTKEEGWSYSLCAGEVKVEAITTETMLALREDESYDTELLPSIFTFREILWQPDVFTEASMSIPSLRILQAFCDEACAELEEKGGNVNGIYIPLIRGVGSCSGKAMKALEKEKADVKKVLGDFRTCVFPIIKFFIYHPKNRNDYFQDAQNRLNYAVKIMLTQFYGRYTELEDPYWKVSFSKTKAKKTPKPEPEEQ
ncbi:MAG: hypothetical protein RLN88_04950 [Ekhidna sp.]|uniref:hypothetical protein n=1 Tax=Ekhidna sp. TaxID=2608089 RepID=UPI0032EBC674